MNENEKHLWLALCELGDYFSRLGGAARYFNMNKFSAQQADAVLNRKFHSKLRGIKPVRND